MYNPSKVDGYLVNTIVAYSSLTPGFETPKLFRALVNVPIGQSPETNPEKWFNEGNEFLQISRNTATAIVLTISELQAITEMKTADSVIVVETSKWYRYNESLNAGIIPNNGIGAWEDRGSIVGGVTSHPALTDKNSEEAFQHVTLTEKTNLTAHIDGEDNQKHTTNQIINAAALANLGTSENAKQSVINGEINTKIGTLQSGTIPTVASGEKVVTRTVSAVNVTKDLVEMQIAPGAIAAADWSTGQATFTGIQGQTTFDANYRYECISANTWIRSDRFQPRFNLYLTPDIDDSGGAKTSAQLNAAYPSALIGQRVWGTDLFLYEKKEANIWKRFSQTTA